MASSSDLRVFVDGDPTTRFQTGQLEALVSRSLEKSTMFDASSGRPVDATAAAPPASSPTPPPSGEYLAKGAAILVLPEAAAPVAPVAPVVAPASSAPQLLPPGVLVPVIEVRSPPRVVEQPSIQAAPPVRRPRRAAVVRARTVRRSLSRHVLKLALLGLVVFCQPWWWNVGDLHARPVATSQK
jgi:hypothetical protein